MPRVEHVIDYGQYDCRNIVCNCKGGTVASSTAIPLYQGYYEPPPPAPLSDSDIERIAQRVADLLRKDK